MKHIVLFFSLMIASSCLLAQFDIGETSLQFNDAGRTINTDVCYPATAAGAGTPLASGQFPVIVFGHGFQLAPVDYDWVKDVLVPKGYIMILPRFSLNIFAPDHVRLGEDVAFILEEMFNNTPTFFAGAIEMKSAVMGHSMGGGVTYHAAANNPNVTTTVTFAAESNTSPTEVVSIAGNVTAPSLVIAGSNDCVSPNADDQIPIYNALGSPFKTYIEITGGSHCQFTDGSFTCSLGEFGCSTGTSEAAQHAAAITLACDWLAYYLQDDCPAFSDFLTTTTNSIYEDFASPINAKVKVFLQGAHNGTDMNTDLQTAGLLPMSEPYSSLGFMLSNAGANLGLSVPSLTGNNGIVDWVVVEARSTTTAVAESVVALVQKDGDVVATDGLSPVAFSTLTPGMYHVAVRHRNHLGVMTQNTVMLTAN